MDSKIFGTQINPESFLGCLNVVMAQLEKYNAERTVAHRQRLVWKLSNRTLRHLRPTDKLRSTLPTIKEFTRAAVAAAAASAAAEAKDSSGGGIMASELNSLVPDV